MIKYTVIAVSILVAGIVSAQFAGGNGTPANPYLVSNATQLNAVRNYPDSHFAQSSTINLNVSPYNSGAGWDPIKAFSGIYDGNGFSITGLYVNRTAYSGFEGRGLFGDITDSAIVRNVYMENVDVRGMYFVGALVGRNIGGCVRNCYSTGSITTTGNYGGYAGGLVGINLSNGVLQMCGSRASVTATSGASGGDIGGLVGASLWVGVDPGHIYDSYATGAIVGVRYVGGLLGHAGGGIVSRSYWDTSTSRQPTSDGGIGRTTAEMTYPYSGNTYVGWNFTKDWNIAAGVNNGYPLPRKDNTILVAYPKNVMGGQRPGSQLIDIFYELVSSDLQSISIIASRDGGVTWNVPTTSSYGDIAGVSPGIRRIVWNAGLDVTNEMVPNMRIRISTARASADSASFPVNTRNSANWTLRAWADKNSDGDYDAGEVISGAEVYYDGRTDAHKKGTTGGDGTFQLTGSIRQGAQVFIRKVIYTEPAVKAGHGQVDNTMYTLWLDSDMSGGDEDTGDGTWSSYNITGADVTTAQSGIPVHVKLAHPVFEWNLVVAMEVTNNTFVSKLQDGFKSASKYLFDVTDGQMKFGKIAIFSNVGQGADTWKNADMVIYSDADYGPNSHVNGIRNGGGWFGTRHMFFGTDWTGWDGGGQNPDDASYYLTIVHEFGHYALDLYDEYLDGDGSEANWDTYRGNNSDKTPTNYGFMDSSYSISEMSSLNDYLPSYGPLVWGHEITQELMCHDLFIGINWYPCWQWVEHNYEKTYNGIPVEIVVPPSGSYPNNISTDRSGPTAIPAPYTQCDFPTVQVLSSQALQIQQASLSAAEQSLPVKIEVTMNVMTVPASGANILRKPNGITRIYSLGRTNVGGFLTTWDIAPGDTLVARYNGSETVQVVGVDDVANGSIRIEIRAEGGLLTQKGVRALDNALSTGDLGVMVSAKVATAGVNNALTLNVHASEPLAITPVMAAYPDDGTAVNVHLTLAGNNSYTGSVSIGAAVGGTFELHCQSADGEILDSTDQFVVSGVKNAESSILYSRDGWVDAHLQPGSVLVECGAVLFGCYMPTIKPDGFNKMLVGPVTFGALGSSEGLNGSSGVVNLAYREADVVGVDETTIKLYTWNQTAGAWDETPSTLSVDLNVVSATVTNLGFLALFADSTADVTPPAQISNLSAITGTNGWDIRLSWTDVGDDGTDGQATSYILKYSTSEIIATNWAACTRYILGINPQISGSTRLCTISMSDPGVHYYFGLVAQDEAGNTGPLSNIADAYSHAGDVDGDLMSDQWERTYGLNPTNALDAASDADGDGLTNLEECGLGTNPNSWDTDGDGMGDKWEVDHNMNPLSPLDRNGDNDNDGLLNFEEYAQSTNPESADTDGDGMPDKWELDNGLNPMTTSGDFGAEADADGDSISNLAEYGLGTCPTDSDSDDDGMDDGVEVNVLYTDPTNPDTDGNGLNDGQFIVSFNAQGGAVDPTNKVVTYGGTYGFLPSPLFADAVFTGWGTNPNEDGASVTSITEALITSNQTIYAQWDSNSIVGSSGFVWRTDGNNFWYAQSDVATNGALAMRSGDIDDNQETWIETAVQGPGICTFWWRVSSEGGYDELTCAVNGIGVQSISGKNSAWVRESVVIRDNGAHAIRWTYAKDYSESIGLDCGWLDGVTWTTNTTTSPVAVPYLWLNQNYSGLSSVADYENVTMNSLGANGLWVWESYVAGLVPTNPGSQFLANIVCSNGVRGITWNPDLRPNRLYTVEGKTNLTDDAWHSPTNAGSRFFRVKVQMP
ncbi:MAG: InlB B-repeat-containing protein [bacterium]